jgi:hypothetical protein
VPVDVAQTRCSTTPPALKAAIAGAKLALVHVDAIDSAGEKGAGLMVFEQVLQRLRSAWQPAARGGGAQVRDHGGPRLLAARRRGPPDPEARAKDGAVAAPRDLDGRGRPPDEVRVPLEQLELRGRRGPAADDARGIAVFDIGKRMLSFVHGGNSLQERVIPVLTIVHRSSGAGGDTMAYGIKARAQEGVAGLHSIAAKVHGARPARPRLRRTPPGRAGAAGRGRGRRPGRRRRRPAAARWCARGRIVATVDAEFEVFFKLVGRPTSRACASRWSTRCTRSTSRPACSRSSSRSRPSACARSPRSGGDGVRRRRSRARQRLAEAPKPAATGRAWLEAFADAGVRELFEHLAAHGVVTEDQAAEDARRGARRATLLGRL